MSDYEAPSHFVDEAQNEEDYDHLLDLELFGADDFGADDDGGQGLDLPEESANQQEVGPSEPPNVHEQQQEVPSTTDVQPPLSLEDFLEDGDFVQDPGNGIASNETPSQAGLMSADDQAHLHPTELGVADPSSTGLPTNGLPNLEQNPDFDFSFLDSQEWRDYGNTGADVDIDDILGISAQVEQERPDREQGMHTGHQAFAGDCGGATDHEAFLHGDFGSATDNVQPSMASRQQSSVNTPAGDSGYGTAARSRQSTRGLTPATPHQVDNATGRPGTSNLQLGRGPATTAARHPLAEAYVDTDDESESSSVTNGTEYETYEENDSLIVPDPLRDHWGRTGQRNWQEVWFNPETNRWQPSASHHDMRATLIARAQAEYPNDRYLHPDPTDGIPHGETAFFKAHQNRGPDRKQCADELFVWREYQPKKDEDGKPLRKSKPKNSTDKHPGFMFEGDRILLDPRNNPVVNHKFIPLTLAVHTDAGKLQEMALKPGCRQVDLWARMPRSEKGNDKSDNLVPLRDKNTRINMPMTRWRERKGTIAGSDREGTDVIMDGLRRFYHHNGFDPVAAGNSVKAFPRDLEPWEVKEVRLGNISQFGGRAGRRALDHEARRAIRKKFLKSIENGKKRQAAKNGDGAWKRSHDDGDTESESSNHGPTKRRRRGQEVDPGLAAFDQSYIGQQAVPTIEHGQNGYGNRPNFVQQQGGYAQAMGHSRVQYSAYGPSTFPTPAPRRTQQHPYGGVDIQATRDPYVHTQAPAPLDNSILNSHFYPEDRYPRFNTGVQNFGPQVPQQTSRFAGQHPTMPTGVHRQGPIDSPYSVPTPARNTLAAGGQRIQQASQQVLGKRRQRDTPDFGAEDAGTTNPGWRVPAAPNSGSMNLNPAYKRQRQNPPPVTEPTQQRHHHPSRTPRPSRYGVGGAPRPLLPLDPIFGGAQSGSNPLGNADGGFTSPATISRELDDLFRDSNPTPTPNVNVDQSNDAPRRHEPRQVLGKHRREGPTWDEDIDIRDMRPANRDESQSLDSALRYTRDAFRAWTGREAPVTNLEHSYNFQYREIRSAFRAWWRSETNPQRGDPLPELWRARRWSGTIDDWDAPEDGEHLPEVRRG